MTQSHGPPITIVGRQAAEWMIGVPIAGITSPCTIIEEEVDHPVPLGPRKGTDKMRELLMPLKKFLQAEDGPTAVEYAVMLALIIVVCITAITAIGTNANKVFSNASLNSAIQPP